MLQFENQKMKQILRKALPVFTLAALLYSCANIGRPEGGDYDEAPPRFIGSSPAAGAVNSTKSKITLEFDEFIKLEKPSEKVLVSPPQLQQPEIKASGKKIQINLLDSLKPNTTYTIDFSDAIVDNNEGNALGNFAFTFSTGAQIDTMEVSGTVLDASNLEPIKGIMVGLHANLNDSAFIKQPFDRLGRTDSRGRFTIRGIAPGKYRIYGLMDSDQNFSFNQKSEIIAFYDSLIVPRMEKQMRMDTAWVDSLLYDTIVEKAFTKYLPDNISLRAFKELNNSQSLIKSERLTPQKFSFYFAGKPDSLPLLKGLNFDEKDAFVIEKELRNDTIHYWVKDSVLYKKDTLSLSLSYLYTDTLNQLVPRTDTLNLVSKQKFHNKDKEELKKKKKKKDEEEKPEPTKFLPMSVNAPSSMDVYGVITLNFEEPIAYFDTAAIHLRQKVDTLWKDVGFEFEQDSLNLRRFKLFPYNDWEAKAEYELAVDSTAFHGIYGLFTDKAKQGFKVRSEDEYFTLHFNVTGADSLAFVELLDAQDKVVRKRIVKDNMVDFYFLNPGKYAARLINDRNGNGEWDTGNFEEGLQPEEVFYYPNILEYKALWDTTQPWNIHATPADKQKPDELKKQKPDENKKQKDRNRERNQR